jgi:hypothetical protein
MFLNAETRKGARFSLPRETETSEIIVNYFRDHVKGLSSMVNPLNNMVNTYKKNILVTWSSEMEQVFKTVKEAVGNCPKLFYVDPSLPIHVRT